MTINVPHKGQVLRQNKIHTAADDAEVDDGGWNGMGNGGINGGMPGGIRPIGGGIKPTQVHATNISLLNQSMVYFVLHHDCWIIQ